MDPVGFEPTTSSMPLRRAPNCAMGPVHKGLFYSVTGNTSTGVDLAGFEPATSSVRLMRAPNCATGPIFPQHCSAGELMCQAKQKGGSQSDPPFWIFRAAVFVLPGPPPCHGRAVLSIAAHSIPRRSASGDQVLIVLLAQILRLIGFTCLAFISP